MPARDVPHGSRCRERPLFLTGTGHLPDPLR